MPIKAFGTHNCRSTIAAVVNQGLRFGMRCRNKPRQPCLDGGHGVITSIGMSFVVAASKATVAKLKIVFPAVFKFPVLKLGLRHGAYRLCHRSEWQKNTPTKKVEAPLSHICAPAIERTKASVRVGRIARKSGSTPIWSTTAPARRSIRRRNISSSPEPIPSLRRKRVAQRFAE